MADFFKLKPRHIKALHAIIEQPTIRKAAAASGVPERTLYHWIRENKDFRQELSYMWQEAFSSGLHELEGSTPLAVRALREVIADFGSTSQEKSQAARVVIQNAIKLAQIRVEEAKGLRETDR